MAKAAGKKVVGGRMEVNGQAVPLSRAVQASGNFVFASGQLALDQSGKLVGEDIEAQTRQVLENVKAILEQAGTSLANVVKCTCWVASADDFAGFNKIYREYFPQDPPARSTLVSQFVVKGARVEVEAVALMPEQGKTG
jgi:2-iminobutanoate/2-iminopropanoate deaminase